MNQLAIRTLSVLITCSSIFAQTRVESADPTITTVAKDLQNNLAIIVTAPDNMSKRTLLLDVYNDEGNVIHFELFRDGKPHIFASDAGTIIKKISAILIISFSSVQACCF